MKRIFLVLALAATMAVLLAGSAATVLAQGVPGSQPLAHDEAQVPCEQLQSNAVFGEGPFFPGGTSDLGPSALPQGGPSAGEC